MALAERLVASNPKPRTAADHYNAWLVNLPLTDFEAVTTALKDRTWAHKQLKNVLEGDTDNPAPKYGLTAFKEWRNEMSS